MARGLMIAVAVVVVVAVAILEGMRSNRWGETEDLRLASSKLDKVPRAFGDWVSTESPLDDKVLKVAEATGNVSRIYTNSKSGVRISVLLLCGPTGPIGAHTPDICYGGLGYACHGEPARKSVVIGKQGASFWTARFEKKTPTDDPLVVWWGWGLDGEWEASSSPRTDYALRGVLYKLYLVRTDNPIDRGRDPNSEPIELFLNEFLPPVKSALAANSN
jgi:hypothetical protein